MKSNMSEIIWRTLAWTPLVHGLDLMVGALLCFLVAFNRGDVSIYLPYISETGAIVPEMCFFSAFVIFGAFLGVIGVFYRFMLLSYIIEKENNLLRKVNILAFLCGLSSMFGLGGVAAFPMSTLLYIHVLISGWHFMCATLYTFVQAYLTFKMNPPYYNKLLCRARLALALFIVLPFVLLIILMPLGHFKWKELYPDRMEATKTPEDKMFGVIFTGALSEWLWYGAWLAFFASFVWENKKFELVTLMRLKNDDGKEPEVYVNGNSAAVY